MKPGARNTVRRATVPSPPERALRAVSTNERECNCPAPDGGACRNCIADELHETEISRVAQVDRTWEAQQRAIFAEARNERLVALLRDSAALFRSYERMFGDSRFTDRYGDEARCRLAAEGIEAALSEEGR